MKLTTRLGVFEIDEKEFIYFPVGILGFSDVRRYVILNHDTESPVKWLQAVDRPELAFPIVPAVQIVSDYQLTVQPEDLSSLGVPSVADLTVVVILTIPRGEFQRTTANLKAPVVINPNTRQAQQVLILEDYPIRYPLWEEQPVAMECAG